MSSPTGVRRRKDVPKDDPQPKDEKRPHRKITKNEFKERTSKLDFSEGNLKESEFRGFFNLLTMALIWFFVATQARKLMLEGTLVGLHNALGHFTRYDLFPSWLFIVGLSFSAFFLQKLILLRVLPRIAISILRVAVQCGFFSIAMVIAVDREWPLVQMTFFLLETLVLSMKMHSYIMTNREYDNQFVANNMQRAKPEGNESSADQGENITRTVQYPDNVTLKNYVFYLIVPTLVYEINYPRMARFRMGYFLEKFSSFVGLWAVMHVLADTYILPVLEQSPSMTQLEAIASLIIPFTVGYMIVFYMVFDIACNGFAELTRFADREFYSDWWNSKTFDEFARKWNKPVHEFLLRHVYLESINTYKMSQTNATLITFLFSSIVHEFFMAFALRIFRPWLFLFQMSQIPLIYMFRIPWLKHNRFNNHFFWFGMILGPPMITLLYAREAYTA